MHFMYSINKVYKNDNDLLYITKYNISILM